MDDLRSRLANQVQLTTDGHKAYLGAVEEAFGADVDYAMLVKMYGEPTGQKGHEKKYSPSECTGTRKDTVQGNPDEKHISTSHVERQNLTMRNSFLMKMFDNTQANQEFFFSNDLTKERNYKSSSVVYNTEASGESCSANRRKWYLPYKSAIVVPIKQEARDDLGIAEGEDILVGFIGIDSPAEGAFSKRWDVPLAKSLANSLFPILRRYAEVDARL